MLIYKREYYFWPFHKLKELVISISIVIMKSYLNLKHNLLIYYYILLIEIL